MKTFTVAGTSKENGELKFRVANDIKSRIAMLERCGNSECNLIALPRPMQRAEAAQYLINQNSFSYARALLESVVSAEKPIKTTAARKPAKKTVKIDPVLTDEDFVEPSDEAVQVAMCRLARHYPQLTAQQLYDKVTG